MAHVFVSYDRDDRDFAEVVQAKLERAGHKTSMDLDILSAGDDWQDKLDVAIRGSDAIVVIMGPEARASDYVAYEWAFALGAGVKVIPLEVRPTPFPPRLDGLHRLDFTGKNRPWDTLLAEVARAEAGRRAANVRGDSDTPMGVQQALRSIDSLVSSERLAAIDTLAQTDHPTALAGLTRALEHTIRDVRAAAARVFPDRANPKIVPGLIDAYWNEHESMPDSGLLLDSVILIGASATPALLDAVKQVAREPSKHHRLRQVLLRALGKTKSTAALPALQEALEEDEPVIRRAAAEALGEIEDPTGAATLRAALVDSDERVRSEAAQSLGRLKNAAAVSSLVDCLAHDTSLMRTKAAEALGRIGDRSAVPALVAALQDDQHSVKKAAAEALGRLGDGAAVSHLRPLLGPNFNGQITELDMTVMAALVRLRDADSLEEIGNRLVNYRTGYYGGGVYEELARYGDEGIEVLVRVLKSERHNSPQSEAAKALESIRRPDVVNIVKAWKRKQR